MDCALSRRPWPALCTTARSAVCPLGELSARWRTDHLVDRAQSRPTPTSPPREIIMKTDSQLQKDVMAELAWEPSVHAAQIGVEVKDGIVTLDGHVATYTEKWNAELAAQRVTGVKALAIE